MLVTNGGGSPIITYEVERDSKLKRNGPGHARSWRIKCIRTNFNWVSGCEVGGVIKQVSGNVRAFTSVYHINPSRNANVNHKLHRTGDDGGEEGRGTESERDSPRPA